MLPRGTPVAQAIPVKREALEIEIGALDEDDIATQQQLRQALQAEPGLYRKAFRRG